MKRRKFLVNSALGTAGITLGASEFPDLNRIFGPNETLRLGVIGCGNRGTGILKLIQEIPGLDAVACSDIIPFRLDEAMSLASKGAGRYTEYQLLLEHENLDGVIIATPFSMHAKMAEEALDLGLHVYCEKTMCRGLDAITSLEEKVASSKSTFQVGHQYHSSRLYYKIHDVITSGYIGDVSAIECQWNRNGDWRRPVPDPKWERMINWRMYREYSGGLTAELSSHQIDFANWILNDTPQRVVGFGSIDFWKDGRETYDNIHLILDYKSGIKAKYTSLTNNKYEGYRIRVKGSKGTIEVSSYKAWIYMEDLNPADLGTVDGVSGATIKAWQKGEGAPINVEHAEPTLQAIIDFRDNIMNDKNPLSNVTTGADTARIVDKGIRSMDEGRVIAWNE